MGFFDRFRRKPKAPADPIAAYDARIDALGARCQLLRKSAATLLAVRRDLDRRVAELEAKERDAKARADAAREADPDAAHILEDDGVRYTRDREVLAEQREKVATDAQDLSSAVHALEAESAALSREREGAKVALAAGGAVVGARPALSERLDELVQLDAARDEVERAHALAEIYREEALRHRGRTREPGPA